MILGFRTPASAYPPANGFGLRYVSDGSDNFVEHCFRRWIKNCDYLHPKDNIVNDVDRCRRRDSYGGSLLNERRAILKLYDIWPQSYTFKNARRKRQSNGVLYFFM